MSEDDMTRYIAEQAKDMSEENRQMIIDINLTLATIKTEMKSHKALIWWVIGMLAVIGGTNFYFNKTMLDKVTSDGRIGTDTKGITSIKSTSSQSSRKQSKAEDKSMVQTYAKQNEIFIHFNGLLYYPN